MRFITVTARSFRTSLASPAAGGKTFNRVNQRKTKTKYHKRKIIFLKRKHWHLLLQGGRHSTGFKGFRVERFTGRAERAYVLPWNFGCNK
jgi:hypothetical protein